MATMTSLSRQPGADLPKIVQDHEQQDIKHAYLAYPGEEIVALSKQSMHQLRNLLIGRMRLSPSQLHQDIRRNNTVFWPIQLCYFHC